MHVACLLAQAFVLGTVNKLKHTRNEHFFHMALDFNRNVENHGKHSIWFEYLLSSAVVLNSIAPINNIIHINACNLNSIFVFSSFPRAIQFDEKNRKKS